jgi:enoyl-CoA hydratase/carnithine racemase
MDFETLKIDADGPIGYLTLNRPERLNAMNATMLRELADAARFFDQHPEVRVVIIRGAGRSFCAGADLKDSSRTEPNDSWQSRRAASQAGSRMMDAIEQMTATTIASVHGYVVGGAVLLMAACDLRVAADDAAFSIPEVELGIPLAWGGIPRLVREIGPAMTKELVMTCRQFTPQEAKAMGFVNRVVCPGELAQETARLAEAIAVMPAVPVAITKQHVNAVTRGIAATSYADGDLLLSAYSSPESQQARLSYVKRRLESKKRD